MKEEKERMRKLDIAEALNLKTTHIANIASKAGIRGESEGLGRGKQSRYTIDQAEAIARAYRGEEGAKQLFTWLKKPEKEKETSVQRALSDSYLYETDDGRLLDLRNVKEFRQEIKQFPFFATALVEEKAIKVFTILCNLFEEESKSTSKKLAIARELREYIKLIISFPHENGIVENNERKLSEIKRAHKEIFLES